MAPIQNKTVFTLRVTSIAFVALAMVAPPFFLITTPDTPDKVLVLITLAGGILQFLLVFTLVCALVKCLKMQKILGDARYEELAVFCHHVTKLDKPPHSAISEFCNPLHARYYSLEERNQRYIRSNIKYYVWLMHKRTGHAILCGLLAICIHVANFTEYDVSIIANFFEFCAFAMTAYTVMEIA